MAKNQIPVGMLSGRLEQEQYGFEPRSRVYAGKDYGWQTEDSYKKTVEQRNGNGFYNGLEKALAPARNGVSQGIQFIEPLLNGVNGVLENSHAGPLLKQLNGATEYIENQAVQNGFDRRVGTSVAMLGEEVLTAGLGRAGGSLVRNIRNLPPPPPRQMVAAASSVGIPDITTQLQPPSRGGQVLEAVTVNNKEVLDTTGRKLGENIIEQEPELAKHLTQRKSNIQKYNNNIERAKELKKILPKGSADYKAADRLLKKSRPNLYSAESNVKPFTDIDPQQYRSQNIGAGMQRIKFRADRLKKGIKISEKIHEHHLVTKGGTAAAFRKMEEFIAKGKADLDDLVVMFEYAEKKNVAPGDRRSNNSFIMDTPHNELHQQVLKPSGDEFKQEQWNKILNELKTPDDLMNWWVDQVNENYVPNKQTGLIWQDLDDLIKEIRPKKAL